MDYNEVYDGADYEEKVAVRPLSVHILIHKKFITIITLSGYSLFYMDPAYDPFHLEPDTDNKTLGFYIRKALKQSRLLKPLRNDSPFLAFMKSRVEEFETQTFKNLGYKTKSAMLKERRIVDIELLNDKLTIDSLDTNGRGVSHGTTDTETNIFTYKLPDSDEELGKITREAFAYATIKGQSY